MRNIGLVPLINTAEASHTRGNIPEADQRINTGIKGTDGRDREARHDPAIEDIIIVTEVGLAVTADTGITRNADESVQLLAHRDLAVDHQIIGLTVLSVLGVRGVAEVVHPFLIT